MSLHLVSVSRVVAAGLLVSAAVAALTTSGGCIGNPANPATTQPVTKVDPKQAEPAYWYAKPSAELVTCDDFEPLWKAALEALKDAGYKTDRLDPRDGVITSLPLVSKQAFELWRNDVADLHGMAQSTIGTVRRIVRFEVTKRDDGVYQLVPKVLVERESFIEHRITSVELYREVFTLSREEMVRRRDLQENPDPNAPPPPPPDYFYPIARDPAMEKRLAEWIRSDLPKENARPSGGATASATGS